MLALDSPRWHELGHAYGAAGDIPAMLRGLASLPSSSGDREPWFGLWSALAHQGDVYASSYAAVPHVVEALAKNPRGADSSFFHFPAWVEICRSKGGPEIPADLQAPYFEALARLPVLVAAAAGVNWEPQYLGCCMAALAVANGQPAMAEVALELTPELSAAFMEWVYEQ